MAVVGGRETPQHLMLGGSGDIELDEAANKLLLSLKQIRDDVSEFDGDRSECESRLQSPMVFNSQTATATGVDSARSQMRDQVSPLSSFQSSPVAMSNRNRVRAGEKPRTLIIPHRPRPFAEEVEAKGCAM